MKSYRPLATNSRFLRGIAFESTESNLKTEDRIEAENLAAVEIDSALSTTFTVAPNAPPVIALLGDLLGSAYLYEFIALQGNLGEKGEATNKPVYLRKKAQQIIDDLRAHKIGVQNIDGSWNSRYPQPSVLPLCTVGAAKNVSIDAGLTWGQMAQGRMSDDEKRQLDPNRDRRPNEMEAALAGAYGL
jgi:hypothetical protein